MVSVIIPVYNVKPYLRKCLDSVVGQTYRDLEILIIDDGSTDGSGKICDEYKKDNRVKVLHTENRGLSCARNLGLDNATGDWIGFVDSDDWIEPDMYEVLIEKALETGADVVECGWFRECQNGTEVRRREIQQLSHMSAVEALVSSKLSDNAWNKIWKAQCFSSIRFPEGRVYEDIATTFRVFSDVESVCSINEIKYHYVAQRPKSLTNTHDLNNLIGRWLSHYERYRFIENKVDEPIRLTQMRFCAEAVARTWSNYYGCKNQKGSATDAILEEMNSFAKKTIPLLGYSGWEVRLRIGIFFPHYYNSFSFRIAWFMDRIYKTARLFMRNQRNLDET